MNSAERSWPTTDVEMELPGLGRRAFSMSARVLREEPSATRRILVAIVDATEVKREGEALEVAKSEAERANIGKSRFLAAASHDLRDGCKRPGVTRAEAQTSAPCSRGVRI